MNFNLLSKDGVIRVACVGDSITAGTENSNYPAFLREYLNYLGTVDGNIYEVENCGKGGAAVHKVLEDLDHDGVPEAYFWYDSEAYLKSLSYEADVVIVQMGTNDGFGGNLDKVDSYFKTDYKNMIKPYLDRGSLVVLATPPCAYNAFHPVGVNGKVSELVREIAKELDLPLIDTNVLTQNRRESFPDGLHGNDSGYSLLAQIYYKYIFGGEACTVTVKTQPGASVDVGVQMAKADENGIAKVTFPRYSEPSVYPVKIICAEYKTVNTTVTVDGDTEIEIKLEEGMFNISKDATATAASVTGENTPALALDGDLDTRWESEYTETSWFTVDLGKAKKVNGVNIWWEGAYAKKYEIEISLDGESFTKILDVEIHKEGLESSVFEETDARYVRINCLEKYYPIFGYSIREINILSDIKE